MPCTPVVHSYVRRWISWSKIAQIRTERAAVRKADAKRKARGGTSPRRRGR